MASSPAHDRRSRAAIAGHPLHPLLVPFPIAFLVGAFATDLIFWGTGDPFWARASLWLIGAGFVMGALAAVAGLIDFLSIREARVGAVGWVHFLGNATAMALALWNLIQRFGQDPAVSILPLGVILSGLVVAIFLVTGWLGGELVFRYRIAVIEEEGTAARSSAHANLDAPRPGPRSGTHG